MTDKQYADMTTIMMFSRIFADQMYKCLENSGLLKQGFILEIGVGKNFDLESGVLACDIDFCKSPEEEDWTESRMNQMRMKDGDWCVYSDPRAKAGDIPPEVRIRRTREVIPERARETASKPCPPDGL